MIIGVILIAALVTQLAVRDTAPVGHFTSAEAKDRYVAAYDEAMKLMPDPDQVKDVRTSFGVVRVYRFTGADDAKAPLVLLPGTLSGTPVWASNIADLLQVRSVYTVDLLGEPGMSIQDRPISSHADQAQWLHEVLQRLPEPQLQLFGLSIGGWTATNLAVRQPDKIAGLTLIEPVRTFADFRLETIIRSIPVNIRWLPKSWRDSFNSYTAGGAPIEDTAEARMIEAGMQGYAMKQPSPSMISPEQLRRLRMPTLVIIAGDSPMHDSAEAEAVARENLPDATVKVYPGASHAINGEHPKQIRDDLATFLTDQP